MTDKRYLLTVHDISLSVPAGFVRDSTQSTQDAWLFEKDSYKQMIIITYTVDNRSGEEAIERYESYLKKSLGLSPISAVFLGRPALQTVYTREGVVSYEMAFHYNDGVYAIALRGGTEKAFNALIDTVKLAGS